MRKISALKLVDEAILPVVIVIAAKIASIFVLTYLFSIPWTFQADEATFGFYFINFKKLSDVYFVVSLSDLVVSLTVAIGFLWVLFRGNYFGEDKIHPITASRLHKKGQESLIVSRNETYHQALIWLSLSWFTFFLVLDNVLSGISSQLTFGITLVTTLGLTITLLENSRQAKH